MPKFPERKVIFVDVDGTLHKKGLPNTRVIAYIKAKRKEGYRLYLWSARGDDHAARWAAHLGIENEFEAILPKPGWILDNEGPGWDRFIRYVDLRNGTESEVLKADLRAENAT